MHTGCLGNLLWCTSAKLAATGWRPIAEHPLFCQLNFCTPPLTPFSQGRALSHRTPRGWHSYVTCLSAWHVYSLPGWQWAMPGICHLWKRAINSELCYVPSKPGTFTLSYPLSREPRMRAGPGTHWNSSYFYCSHAPRLLAFMFGDLELGFLWPAKGWHSIWACNQLDHQVLATPFPFS